MTDEALLPDDIMNQILADIESVPEEAVEHLRALIPQYRADARLPYLCGSVLAGLGQYAEAHALMRAAVTIAPGYDLARFHLGLLELTSGDGAAAEATWAPLLDRAADQPLRLFVEGLQHMVKDAFTEATRLLQEGIARNTLLPPLNKDMKMLIDEMARKIEERADEAQIESDANFLLKQFSFKPTRH